MKLNKFTPSFLLVILFLVLFFGSLNPTFAQSSPVPIIWQNLVDVTASGNTITKTTPNGWGAGASGASSSQYIPTGYEGYVEFSMTNNAGMAGLSNGDPDADYPSLDYAIQAGPNYGSSVVVYENGIQKATSPLLYSSSDRYRVALESGSIKYYHNSTLIYTSTQTPVYPLLFDTALYANGGQIQNAVIATDPIPPTNIKPPKISNVKVTNITQTGATITWDTNETSDSRVEYCLTASRCGVNSTLNPGLVTSHSIDLSGLVPNTYYFIWVKSKDGTGNQGVLGYYLFKTVSGITSTPINTPSPTPTPINPPLISNIQVINITRDSATVTWDTDRPADSGIYSCTFGLLCFNSLLSNSNLTTYHSFNISKLRADRNYYILVTSTDANGGQGSNLSTFRTQPGLTIANVRATNITQSSATIIWDTNYSANSGIVTCKIFIFCFFSLPIRDPMLAQAHLMTVMNLSSGTTYYYQAVSVDPLGYSARSNLTNFKTP